MEVVEVVVAGGHDAEPIAARGRGPVALDDGPVGDPVVGVAVHHQGIEHAAADLDPAHRLAGALACEAFRPYASDDLIGVELGGAVKNVLAIAAGVVAGRGLGEGARAALIARGLSEMTRLGAALGARAETFAGLSGLGDLVLTATSRRSRNLAFGMALGEGQPAANLLAPGMPLVEGAHTAGIAAALAERCGMIAALKDGRIDDLRRSDDMAPELSALLSNARRS